jgi:hypothetical protein
MDTAERLQPTNPQNARGKITTSHRKADVAQLVEQPIRNRQVIGSSPIVGSSLMSSQKIAIQI